MIDIKAVGRILGTNTGDVVEATGCEETQVMLTGQAEELTANAAAIYQDASRIGRSFWVANAIGTPVSAVTAIPTTAHMLALYNNEPDGGRSYVINYVWVHNVAVTAVTIFHAGIIGLLGQVREAIPTNAAPVVKNANSGGKLDTRARTIIGGTALPAGTGLAANWMPLSTTFHNKVVTLPGHGAYVPIDGRIIVPPGRYFAVHVLASITTNTYIAGIGWTEKNLVLG